MSATTTAPMCQYCGAVLIAGTVHHCQWQRPLPYFVQTGWVCPVCGSGVAPSLTVCPCKTTRTYFGMPTDDSPRVVARPHPEYGLCDSLGGHGACSQCSGFIEGKDGVLIPAKYDTFGSRYAQAIAERAAPTDQGSDPT